jgi:Tfp pilus assembly protein PilW
VLVQVTLLLALLIATLAFHVSGTTLVELRIARLILVVAAVVGLGWFSRRRSRDQLGRQSEHADDGSC